MQKTSRITYRKPKLNQIQTQFELNRLKSLFMPTIWKIPGYTITVKEGEKSKYAKKLIIDNRKRKKY